MIKRGQVSIFVILAVVGVAMVSTVVYLSMDKEPGIEGDKAEENPKYYLEECIEDNLREVVKNISLQGGYAKKSPNITFRFENETKRDIAYLCYNRNYYLPCTIQQPMLMNHLENETAKNIKDNVEGCFDNYTILLDEKGHTVEAKYKGFDVILETGRIIIDIDGYIKLTKSGETTKQENLRISYRHSLYDLAEVTHEIISQEANYCNFDKIGYMIGNRNINIKEKNLDEGSIYTITDIQSKDKFRFAVRSCVIPKGV